MALYSLQKPSSDKPDLLVVHHQGQVTDTIRREDLLSKQRQPVCLYGSRKYV